MEITIAKIQAGFRTKLDEELVVLAANASGMKPEARIALLTELRTRCDALKNCSTTIPLVQGFYAVQVSREGIKFPDVCPNCLKQGADTPIDSQSRSKINQGFFRTRRRYLTLHIPHCAQCAKSLNRKGKTLSWLVTCAAVAWGVACWYFNLGRLAFVAGLLALFVPVTIELQSGIAVKLGDFDDTHLECGFKFPEYAESFASMNHVVAQNRDTFQNEMVAAISSIQKLEGNDETVG